MQALRLARTVAVARPLVARRGLATATANHVDVASASSSSSAASRVAPIPLSNVEAQWEKLSAEEKLSVHEQLEVLQQKDWKELSLDQKKAAYYVAFGPHGPRAPTSQPGDNMKILLSTLGLVGVSAVLYYVLQAYSNPLPKTMTKEWQEASNERAKEMKLNPLSAHLLPSGSSGLWRRTSSTGAVGAQGFGLTHPMTWIDEPGSHPNDSDEEDAGDYDNVVGFLTTDGDSHIPQKSRSRHSSLATQANIKTATTTMLLTEHAGQVFRIEFLSIELRDPEQPFDNATQDLNDEILQAKNK
ncbi:unnamed protein product [Cyclocybe aegerita]|uniref:Cytochrome c oxidase subunit IV n=1 Tax=Cyclocybe aegerita TaxID=1973307 RepID=A0A8S0XTK9_CYCAE|nr:unnamed protein product [Cyclocybe aegerita]